MAAYNNIAEYINSDPELIKAIYDKDENVIKVDNNLNKGLMIAKSPRIIVLEFKIIAVSKGETATVEGFLALIEVIKSKSFVSKQRATIQ